MFLVKAGISSSSVSSSLNNAKGNLHYHTTNTFEVISHRAPDRRYFLSIDSWEDSVSPTTFKSVFPTVHLQSIRLLRSNERSVMKWWVFSQFEGNIIILRLKFFSQFHTQNSGTVRFTGNMTTQLPLVVLFAILKMAKKTFF